MSYTADEHDRAKSDMLGEFNKAIADAENLRKAGTGASDDRCATAREAPGQDPGGSASDPAGASEAPAGTAMKTASAPDDCMRDIHRDRHDAPWPFRPRIAALQPPISPAASGTGPGKQP